MRENICSHEIAVARGVRTGLWDSAVRDHAAACAACNELIIAATNVRSLAEGIAKDSGMPDAAWLWRKALLEQKQAETDRAQRPFRVAQVLSIPAVIVVLSVLIAWCSTQLQAYLEAHGQSDPWVQLSQAWWSFAAATPHVSPEGLSLVLLLVVAAFFAAQPLLAED